MTEETRTVHLVITGRVQGVGFRYWCVRQAGHLGLVGWVRNRRDGSVEAVAHGPSDAVAQLIDACRSGPAGASVSGVLVSDADTDEVGNGGFQQMATI